MVSSAIISALQPPFGHSVIRSFGHSVVLSFGRSVVRSFGHSIIRIIRIIRYSVIRSFGHLAASASSREGAASDHVVTGCGGPLVPVDVREVHGEICVSFVTIQFLFQKANKQQRYD